MQPRPNVPAINPELARPAASQEELHAIDTRQLERHGGHGERLRALEIKIESLATTASVCNLESKIAWKLVVALTAGCAALLAGSAALIVSILRLLQPGV